MSFRRPTTLSEMKFAQLEAAERQLIPRNFERYLRLKDLLKCNNSSAQKEFRRVFRSFYGMTVRTGASVDFDKRFFEILFLQEGPTPSFSEVVGSLAHIPTPSGKRALQFSFASKLVAMHRENSPIYDRHVRSFFNEKLPSQKLSDESRILLVDEFLRHVENSYEGWMSELRVQAMLKRMAIRDPNLGKCHANRLLDILVWKVGNLAERERRMRAQGKP